MIHIPIICRTAINASESPVMRRLFVKASMCVLRDLAVAIGEHDITGVASSIESAGGIAAQLKFSNLTLKMVREVTTRALQGGITEVSISACTGPGRTTTASVSSMATAASQLHFVNIVRSKRNVPLWSMGDFLGRRFSRIGQAA